MLTERQFADIYRKFSDQIWRYCYLRTNDSQLAEDMTQEVFTKAWQADAFATANHRAYLYRSMRNLLVDHWRRNKPVASLDAPIDEDGNTMADMIEDTDAPSPIEIADQKRTLRDVAAAIQEIPQKLQDVLILRFVNELSTKETAEALKISEGNVRVLQHRGLKELKKVMK
jgi:RNA polymerase sigma-70 factor (ECF subfamily)